ncbi:MAG TPA: metal ABC transporter permease [Acetivibrio sp.]|uniref:metal ABC transporter permease n=1 Tax=Acetivibrio sp. TaxID=1872092 RepID=UPI002C2BB6F2|nr:metal ABC transporter permease [Acetivibrio sp.]HOM01723.1 metal ABC transporter permease [Acetivibrio sp.]
MSGIFGEDFILNLGFMQRAYFIGILIAIMAPAIGVIIVLRRQSMIGDSLSHTSLAGVAFGLIAGINPIVGATLFSITAALGIEKIRRAFPKYAEISIAVIMSTGIGLAGVLSGYVKSGFSLSSYLFGSIIAISDFELIIIAVLSTVVIVTFAALFKELFFITFDEEAARLAGVPVKIINFIFAVLTAVTVAVSSRIVGTLVISSLLVLPPASAMQIAKSFKQTIVYSLLYGIFSIVTGLTLSFYLDMVPGGTIVLISAICLVLTLVYKNLVKGLIVKKTLTKAN